MTEAMPFLQKAILLSYAPRSFPRGFLLDNVIEPIFQNRKVVLGMKVMF